MFPNMSVATKAALTVATAVLVILAALIGEYAMITANYGHADAADRALIVQEKANETAAIKAAVAYSNSQWCDTLTLLTAKTVPYPSDPSKNPSRLETYNLYEDFVHVKVKFNCKEQS